MPTVNDLIARLQQLVKEDPSVGELPVYTNGPMDAEYAFELGHANGVYVNDDLTSTEDCHTYINQGEVPEDNEGDVTTVRAVVIDTH